MSDDKIGTSMSWCGRYARYCNNSGVQLYNITRMTLIHSACHVAYQQWQ